MRVLCREFVVEGDGRTAFSDCCQRNKITNLLLATCPSSSARPQLISAVQWIISPDVAFYVSPSNIQQVIFDFRFSFSVPVDYLGIFLQSFGGWWWLITAGRNSRVSSFRNPLDRAVCKMMWLVTRSQLLVSLSDEVADGGMVSQNLPASQLPFI